jgi:hypothetical protein
MSSSAADSARRSRATGSRGEQELAEHQRRPSPDQRVDQPLRAGLAVGHGDGEDRADGRLTDRDPDPTQRDRDGHRGERGQGQGPVPAAQGTDRELSRHDANDHPDQQPHRVRAALPPGGVQRDDRGDRGEERLAVIDKVLRDQPRHRRGGRALQQRPRARPTSAALATSCPPSAVACRRRCGPADDLSSRRLRIPGITSWTGVSLQLCLPFASPYDAVVPGIPFTVGRPAPLPTASGR